jgi:CRP/FNR family transcriptional regulator, cyclic AMP receptor protein
MAPRNVALVEHRLLRGLAESDRRALLARLGRRSYRKGDTLFHEGDPGDSLHLIEKGRLAIRASTRAGDEAILAVLGRGDCFGEQALLSPTATRTASVVALEPVETRVLLRTDFEQLRREQPSVDRFLVEVLAAQVRRLSGQLLDALYLPVETRVLRRLTELAALYAADDSPVEVPLRQEELASLAGSTRSTTNRVLQQLVDDNIVDLRRGRIVILDVAALADRAR